MTTRRRRRATTVARSGGKHSATAFRANRFRALLGDKEGVFLSAD